MNGRRLVFPGRDRALGRNLTGAALLSACCLASTSASSADDSLILSELSRANPEAMLVRSLQEIAENRMDAALDSIEQLLRITPNFRLAQLVKGDLLMARARAISDLGDGNGISRQSIVDLREEARARVQRHRETVPRNMVPRYLLQMPPEQKYAIIADTRRSRLYAYQNVGGEPRYLADYYISSGKNGSQKLKEGDKKTPVGVYFITANLPREKLTDFYGNGAFPIDYPNEWDKRHGRNGYGIWLHGTPSNTYSRPPRASDGCVVLSNQDLDTVSKLLQVGITPVIISDETEWSTSGDTAALRSVLAQQLESWRRDWESGNIDSYVRHYGQDFSSGSQGLAEWIQHKRQVGATKNWIRVSIENVGMYRYPGRDDLVVIDFDQEYASNNLSNRMKKRQYWMREKNEGGSWKIIYENAA
ncbi:murein L,D-transpeptidase family protein [Nitrosovibrio sp. Nv17]|uniref:L,D-transpeptidase family protein n=1 Tax=Nitrosovibrio sp. Nv17 TaxID=1855339 RepID=UPI000908D1B3|nr:L,D-transpeptidase family protein [Nitrosovibrio sp. Nv17]SFW35473.1 Murein L,D-transpeptidase YafK [Nitrosovibrio sp. Nv17]